MIERLPCALRPQPREQAHRCTEAVEPTCEPAGRERGKWERRGPAVQGVAGGPGVVGGLGVVAGAGPERGFHDRGEPVRLAFGIPVGGQGDPLPEREQAERLVEQEVPVQVVLVGPVAGLGDVDEPARVELPRPQQLEHTVDVWRHPSGERAVASDPGVERYTEHEPRPRVDASRQPPVAGLARLDVHVGGDLALRAEVGCERQERPAETVCEVGVTGGQPSQPTHDAVARPHASIVGRVVGRGHEPGGRERPAEEVEGSGHRRRRSISRRRVLGTGSGKGAARGG